MTLWFAQREHSKTINVMCSQCGPRSLPQAWDTLCAPDVPDRIEEPVHTFRPEHAMVPYADDLSLKRTDGRG